MRLSRLTLLLTVVALASTVAAAGRAESDVLYERAKAGAVEVLVAGHLAGSGWIADPSGVAVSAAHVFPDTKPKLEVRGAGLGRLAAELIAVDRGRDLALLRLPKRETEYPYLRVARQVPPPGQDVFLFAAALYRHNLLIRGAVARPGNTFEYLSASGHYVEVYHVSAPTPQGTSGGCWLNAAGEVGGVQSGFIAKDQMGSAFVSGPEGIESLLRRRHTVTTATLGTAFEEMCSQPTGFLARFPEGTEGLVPVLPNKDGPAERAGLTGDIVIISMDGQPVSERDPFLRQLMTKQPGDTVRFTVLPADGAPTRQIDVRLGEL